MSTGTGGQNTEIGAYLLGCVSGFGAGLILIRLGEVARDTRTQLIAGALAFGLVFYSWSIALIV